MSVEVGLKRNAAGSWRKLGWMVLELGTQPLTNKKSIGKLIHHTKCMADTQSMRETSKFFEWEKAGRQRKPAVKWEWERANTNHIKQGTGCLWKQEPMKRLLSS